MMYGQHGNECARSCSDYFYADCVPLYFVDPVRKAIGLSHSGWRGTVGRIGQITVEKMTQEYGTRPEDFDGGYRAVHLPVLLRSE